MFTTWDNCLLRGGNDGYSKGYLNGCKSTKMYLHEFSFGLAWVMGAIEIASSNLHMSAIKIAHF
jgi:hypothetical protein